jgi:hypothetical protein
MSGTPFAANPLAGVYYPPNWLFLFLPWISLEVGLNLSAFMHLWLAGAAMYGLMRRGLSVGVGSSLAAAVAYEASPKLLAHLGAGHIGWAQAWAWLPLVVLCTVKVCKSQVASGKWASEQVCRWAVGGGAALAMQFCADVRMAAYTLAAIAALILVFAIHHSTFTIRYSLFPIRTFATFLGLTACQWLPMVGLLPHTTRSLMTLQDAAVWSLPWRYLTGLLLADHGGFHEWMVYIGVSTLVMAVIGARALWRQQEKRWLFGWLMALLIGAGWFSLGENGGLFQVLYRVVPGLGLLRVPPRAWVLVVFAMAVLAGLGIESREQEARRIKRGWSKVLPLILGAFPPMLMIGYWLTVGKPPLNLILFGIVTPLTIVLATIRHSPFATRHSLLAILLIAVDLLIVDATLIEGRPPDAVFADGRAAAGWLAARNDGRFRTYSPSYSIPQHVAERYSLHLADGVDPLQLQAYADYLTRAAGLEPDMEYSVTLPPFPEGSDVRTALKGITPDAKMLGQLGVRYVVAAFPITHDQLTPVDQFDDVYLYRNEEAELRPITPERSIMLADGTTLFHYRPWPVYAGWAVSGLTMLGLLIAWGMGRAKGN